MISRSVTLLIGMFILAAVSLKAATKKWDGGAGNPDWVSGLNWNPDNVPSSSDDIVLDSSIVALPTSMVFNGGIVGAQTLTFAAAFNPTSTTLVGNGANSVSYILLGSSGTGSNPLIKV